MNFDVVNQMESCVSVENVGISPVGQIRAHLYTTRSVVLPLLFHYLILLLFDGYILSFLL